MREKKRRAIVFVIVLVITAVGMAVSVPKDPADTPQTATVQKPATSNDTTHVAGAETELATAALQTLPTKGRAPKTGYAREQFGAGWAEVDNCDMRNFILHRDMTTVQLDTDNCTVRSGTLNDPYTGKAIQFIRGKSTSSAIQIDHVVALSDAWQTGAQALPTETRAQFANDPLELLAVDGPANQQKSDGDAATWLPSNKVYRCRYVARQIAVKQKYNLWVTAAERTAMEHQLGTCPDQPLPLVDPAS